MRIYTTADVIKMLKKRQGSLSGVAFAKELGISQPYLSDVYRGNRTPGKRILVALGLKMERNTSISYLPIGKEERV